MNNLPKNIFFSVCVIVVLGLSTVAFAAKKRQPNSSAQSIKCLNDVHVAFKKKWVPLENLLKIEGNDLSAQDKKSLKEDQKKLIKKKTDANLLCQKIDSNGLTIEKIVEPLNK